MGGELGSRGERGSRLGSRHGEKIGSRGEKRGDRCLVINSHWASATKASAPMEQVNSEHCIAVCFPSSSHNRPVIFVIHWLEFVFIAAITIISN